MLENTTNTELDITEFMQARFGEPVYNAAGNPICGALNSEGNPCSHYPGWGTTHSGFGPCRTHGGDSTETALIKPQKTENSYSIVVSNSELANLISAEHNNYDVDASDPLQEEIILTRALIKYSARLAGMEITINNEGDLDAKEGALGLNSHVRDILSLTQNLSQLIGQRKKLIKMDQNMVSESRVKSYMARAQGVLNNTLRDTCIECGHVHNMRNEALKGLELLGDV